MLKIAICDDEKLVCKQVHELVRNYNRNYTIYDFHTGTQLLKSPKEFDVIFLDIEMPELNGLDAADILRRNNKNTYIIFLTNHTEVMQEAFKVRAYRFFEKPLSYDVFSKTMSEIEKEILSDVKIPVNTSGNVKLVNLSEIVYIEAYGDGTYIHTIKGTIESRKQLVYWNRMLENKGFFRIHQSYLISLDYVECYAKDVKMLNKNETLPVSRRNIKEFKLQLNQYIMNHATVLVCS